MVKRIFISLLVLLFTRGVLAGDCVRTGSVCVDAAPSKVISGVTVTLAEIGQTCWEYEDTYECRTGVTINDCQPLRDRGCAQIGSQCVSADDQTGACLTYEQKYQCSDKPEKVVEKTVCDQSAFCQDNGVGCFDTSSPQDTDFGRTVALMEAAREAGVYGSQPLAIFKGFQEECSIKVLGGWTLKSCCKSAGGGGSFTNAAVLSAAATVGAEALDVGSSYVYDALYDSQTLQKGLGAMLGWAGADGAFNPSFSVYGFTFEFTFANGFAFTGFDPYSFAFSIGMMMIQEWLSCDQAEQILAMKKGQNLCVHTETYCSSKILKICVERKERHCCFNSRLAKIINVQGKSQLGIGMAGCRGFTQEEFESLDFARIDLSEFIAEIIPKEPNLANVTNRVSATVQQRVQNYYEQ